MSRYRIKVNLSLVIESEQSSEEIKNFIGQLPYTKEVEEILKFDYFGFIYEEKSIKADCKVDKIKKTLTDVL